MNVFKNSFNIRIIDIDNNKNHQILHNVDTYNYNDEFADWFKIFTNVNKYIKTTPELLMQNNDYKTNEQYILLNESNIFDNSVTLYEKKQIEVSYEGDKYVNTIVRQKSYFVQLSPFCQNILKSHILNKKNIFNKKIQNLCDNIQIFINLDSTYEKNKLKNYQNGIYGLVKPCEILYVYKNDDEVEEIELIKTHNINIMDYIENDKFKLDIEDIDKNLKDGNLLIQKINNVILKYNNDMNCIIIKKDKFVEIIKKFLNLIEITQGKQMKIFVVSLIFDLLEFLPNAFFFKNIRFAETVEYKISDFDGDKDFIRETNNKYNDTLKFKVTSCSKMKNMFPSENFLTDQSSDAILSIKDLNIYLKKSIDVFEKCEMKNIECYINIYQILFSEFN